MAGWMAFVLGSALFLALYDLAKKASVRDNDVPTVLLFASSFGCVAFGVALCARGGSFPSGWFSGDVVVFSAVKAGIVAASWVFTFTALRTLPITIATPIRSASPALVFLAALFLYREVPTWRQGVGMLTVFAGYACFSWAGRFEGIRFGRNRAVGCAVVGSVLSAVSSLWDKYLFQVRGLPVEGVQLFFELFLVVAYGSLILVRRALGLRRTPFAWRWTIPWVGILLVAADWLYFRAVAIPGVPISEASLLRRFSVVLTFALGIVFFRERNIVRKAIALALLLLGLALLRG